ncbi:MAG TPA: L,D-transpeptidase [Longimicrobiales bacterium]|nr:L,D-transpeptidase [Longimicrobiales bacterium]
MTGTNGNITTKRRGFRSLAVALTGFGVLGAAEAYSQPVAQMKSAASAVISGVPTDSPIPVPEDKEGLAVYRAALKARGTKILISTEARWLWLIMGRDTLVSAPVAIGMGTTFDYNGKSYEFSTPRGKRLVRLKQENPIWTVPEWHYYEKAAKRGLEAVHLQPDSPYLLEDGTWLDIRDGAVGRVNQFGNWWPFSQDFEIIFEGKIFIPPMNTIQRRVTNALGPYKLDMGEGYLIHGTHSENKDSIGQAASHGCVRMRNDDLTILYQLVPAGTSVFIF